MTFRAFVRSMYLVALCLPTSSVWAEFSIVTTTQELGWVLRTLMKNSGMTDVRVDTLLKGTEDPHHVDAHPSFVLKASNASMLCYVGLELEVGWLPKIIERSANPAIQSGKPGDCDASRLVTVLEKPTGAIDRSMGDVHASGNPHYWLSPKAMVQVTEAVAENFGRAYPWTSDDQRSQFQRALKAFIQTMEQRYSALKDRWAKATKGQTVTALEYHKEFTYFFAAYGIRSLGSLEEKPGLPPSAARLAQVATLAKQSKARFLLTSPTHPKSSVERFRELSGIPTITAQSMLRSEQDYFDMQELLIQSLLPHATVP